MSNEFSELVSLIDIPNRRFSMLLVSPNERFLSWLADYSSRSDLEGYNLYSPEENAVVIIPSLEEFSAPGSFDRFIQTLTPYLLNAELARFCVADNSPAIECPVTVDSFHEYFDIEAREFPILLSEIGWLPARE